MLFSYLQQVQRLLGDVVQARYNRADLVFYVNQARGQLAGESECLRVYATLALAAGTQQYPFSAITLTNAPAGTEGVLTVRTASYQVADGARQVMPRSWPWFNLYILCSPEPETGAPSVYAQYGQGASGTLFFNMPDQAYTLNLDTACYPAALALDTDPEAIPYLWTDAVPYYAAYLALLSMMGADDRAQKMLDLYGVFVERARRAATPSVLQSNYEQTSDPTLANKLGSQPLRSASDIGAGAQGGKPHPAGR